ncbi:uncharacterized protein LOC128953254 [Oppia nitens]|uniref:uncharacterized protein LOC128953254 n=1 Tax=Oppia nitens TaxID=1686743 RepID=UPI0023DA84E5|nr:uncharacterized protein LOC128953254 [Oppia nitens]
MNFLTIISTILLILVFIYSSLSSSASPDDLLLKTYKLIERVDYDLNLFEDNPEISRQDLATLSGYESDLRYLYARLSKASTIDEISEITVQLNQLIDTVVKLLDGLEQIEWPTTTTTTRRPSTTTTLSTGSTTVGPGRKFCKATGQFMDTYSRLVKRIDDKIIVWTRDGKQDRVIAVREKRERLVLLVNTLIDYVQANNRLVDQIELAELTIEKELDK